MKLENMTAFRIGGLSIVSVSVALVLAACGGGGVDVPLTKLDAEGNTLSEGAKEWACVRDNVHDKIWQAHSSEEGLHSISNTYTWYEPDLEGRKGSEGVKDGGQCTGSRCDTSGYAAALNELKYCGKDNWRLPGSIVRDDGQREFETHQIPDMEGFSTRSFFPVAHRFRFHASTERENNGYHEEVFSSSVSGIGRGSPFRHKSMSLNAILVADD